MAVRRGEKVQEKRAVVVVGKWWWGMLFFTFFPEVVYRSAFLICFEVACSVVAVSKHVSLLIILL